MIQGVKGGKQVLSAQKHTRRTSCTEAKDEVGPSNGQTNTLKRAVGLEYQQSRYNRVPKQR
jgi:hypothetical protein